MRFGIRKSSRLFPDIQPILTTGDHYSNIRLWDLQALTDGHHGSDISKPRKSLVEPAVKLRKALSTVSEQDGSRENSVDSSIDGSTSRTGSTATPAPNTTAHQESGGRNRDKYSLHGPEKLLKPHVEIPETKNHIRFTTRAIDWSVCGQYCVLAGEAWDRYPKPDESPEIHGAMLAYKILR